MSTCVCCGVEGLDADRHGVECVDCGRAVLYTRSVWRLADVYGVLRHRAR